MGEAPAAFQIMTKPSGAACNLDCKYCFYLEKQALYPETRVPRMSPEVQEAYIRQYIEAQPTPEVTFAWQGGEPLLMGLDFFRRAVELQAKYAGGRKISNALQTNGILLNDAWSAFFKERGFLLGISVDGPEAMHDAQRKDPMGGGSHAKVMAGMASLKRHGVDFNTLTVVNAANAHAPREVYRWLREQGSGYMQFIPLVEREGDGGFAPPPQSVADAVVSPMSVTPGAWGGFLCGVFDEWVRRDVGKVFVQYFDCMLGLWLGAPASMCVFAPECGRNLALEHNGDVYSCDHYVYPEYRLGNILKTPLPGLVASQAQADFGKAKKSALPRQCRECEWLFACHGECPKHRFAVTKDGEAGLNYLCSGFMRFFRHIDPSMRRMAALVQSGRPAADIMVPESAPVPAGPPAAGSRPGRNQACPCGSGRKYKFCHGKP